jgi:hypothetical protein
VKLLICAPIPCPDAWMVAAELPPGYMVLRSITIVPSQRDGALSASKKPGTALVRSEDIQSATDDLQRLVRAYALCDAAGRAEVLKIAEVLAGAAP